MTFTPTAAGETWRRNFAGRTFTSHLAAGAGREAHLLTERFGLITIALALVVRDGELHFVPRSWQLGHIPLPRALVPHGISFESQGDGRFNFDVTINLPIIGRLAAYKGYLAPEQPA